MWNVLGYLLGLGSMIQVWRLGAGQVAVMFGSGSNPRFRRALESLAPQTGLQGRKKLKDIS